MTKTSKNNFIGTNELTFFNYFKKPMSNYSDIHSPYELF